VAEPELLASGREQPPSALHQVVRRAQKVTVPVTLVLAVLAATIAVATHHSANRHHTARAAHPATTPVALPAPGPAAPAAPVTADLARVVVNPATHRLRLIFTVFNAQTSRVVLLRAGQDSAGLVLRGRSLALFGPGGSWRPARLPMALGPAQSAHITLDYGVRRCPPADAVRLRVPAVLAARERGRVDVDLAALVPPHDWPRGLISVLCPISSR
jgi:hypothetical protein